MNKIILGIAALIIIAVIAATIPDITLDTETEQTSCDPSYPGFCIPTFPPDLECEDIPYAQFRVKGDDPHGFDPDNNGVGCEISTTPPSDLPEIAGDVESFDIVEFSLVYTKEGGIAGISESVSIDSAEGLLIKKTSQGVEEISLDESQIEIILDSINDASLYQGQKVYFADTGWADYFMYTLQIRTGDAKTDFAWTDTNNVPELFHISSLLEGVDQKCSGDARCISGTVSKVVDGDTIHVDGQSIRFALSSTPEMNTAKGGFARDYVLFFCPIGSAVIVDEDDGQTDGSYERILGVVYCNGLNLNEAVLEAGHGVISSEFCDTSEFADTAWAQKFGCTEMIVESQSTCEGAGGMWGIWGNAEFTPDTCNAATSDAGVQCSDSSQCQSFCQAEEGTEIDSETVGACYGYELAICMQEVRNGVAQAEWCQ